jgi:hypothetical protein
MGDAKAAGNAQRDPKNLVELATHMAADVSKLTVGLRNAGLDPLAVNRLASDAHGLTTLAAQMATLTPELAVQEVPNFTAARPLTKRLEGRAPGQRPDVLDYAARKLESQLRAERLNREPELLHPVERVAADMAYRAAGRRVGGNDIDELNRAAAAKRERQTPRGPRDYLPPETYQEPVKPIYRSK